MGALLSALTVAACTATAAAADELYQGQAIVTGIREGTRAPALAKCLADVLVKVSGDPRLAGDPRVAAMAGQASAFVAGFGYRDRLAGLPVNDEQGTRDRPYDLTVTFEPAKIDAALRSLGREPWPAPRPRVVVFLGVRDLAGATYFLARDGDRGRTQREALAAAAGLRGLPAELPTEASLADAGLRFETLLTADTEKLDAVARAASGDLALVGRMVWKDTPPVGWTSEWHLGPPGGNTQRWTVRESTFDEVFRHALADAAGILSGHGPLD